MLQLAATVAFLLPCLSFSQTTNICDQNRVKLCAESLARLVGKTELVFAQTRDELLQICPQLQSAMTCVDDFNFQCYASSLQSQMNMYYAGIRDFLNELCEEGDTQNEFLRHAPCMTKVEKQYELCSEEYANLSLSDPTNKRISGAEMAATSGSSSSASQTQEADPEMLHELFKEYIKPLCCPFANLNRCARKLYGENCGPETAGVAERLLMKMAGPVTKEVCLDDRGEFLCSSAPSSGRWANLLTIVLSAAILRRVSTS